jgi:putative oxidoreductase
MNTLQRIGNWGDTHHPKWLVVFRILLGVLLITIGIVFIQERDSLMAVIKMSPFLAMISVFIALYIVFAHLAGGILIATGTITRWAIVANIPILLGAIIFLHARSGLFFGYPEGALSILILALLIFFLIMGPGPVSMDTYIKNHPEKNHFVV